MKFYANYGVIGDDRYSKAAQLEPIGKVGSQDDCKKEMKDLQLSGSNKYSRVILVPIKGVTRSIEPAVASGGSPKKSTKKDY